MPDEPSPPSGSTSKLAFSGALLVGKYRLERVIGTGGMGSVWSATHMGLSQPIAIKLVSSSYARSSEALRRFDNEAKAAAQIRSRHVPQVFDNGVLEDGTPYLAMELLQGETLFARVHKKGPVPLQEGINILEQCCRALGRAHSLGIVHRDVKPENIYLAHSVDDEDYVVKVLDFGIAKMTALENGQTSQTRTGALLGTPMYMSPEQARGLRSIDHRTDLYSLGLVSYMMFTGNVAFGGQTLGELLLQICTQPLPSLLANARWLPPGMEAWFQKACAREPENRFQSAHELVEGLKFAAGIGAPPAGTHEPLPRYPLHMTQQQSDRPPGPEQLRGQPTTSDATAPRAVPATWQQPSTTSGASFEDGAAGVPNRRTGILVSVLAGLLGLGIAVAGVSFFVRRAHAPTAPAASTLPAPSAAAPTMLAVPSVEAPAADPIASASASAAGVPSAAAPPPSKPGGSPPAIPPVGPGPASGPKPPPPPTPNKPSTVDLGY